MMMILPVSSVAYTLEAFQMLKYILIHSMATFEERSKAPSEFSIILFSLPAATAQEF